MRKQLLLGLVFLILAISAFLGYQSYKKIKVQEAFNEQIQKLPDPDLFQWVGEGAQKGHKSTVVMFFHPDCEHCQYEAKEITGRKSAFADINLWWISAADASDIKEFDQTYGLSKFVNTYLAHIPGEKIMQTFGSVSVPHIFIYDEQGLLQKQFKGETRIDAILKYVNTPD